MLNFMCLGYFRLFRFVQLTWRGGWLYLRLAGEVGWAPLPLPLSLGPKAPPPSLLIWRWGRHKKKEQSVGKKEKRNFYSAIRWFVGFGRRRRRRAFSLTRKNRLRTPFHKRGG